MDVSSTKCPHWVLLDFRTALKRRNVQRHEVLGRRLVSFVDRDDEVHVLDDACPHRGASLAGGVVDEVRGGVVCPYHSMCVGIRSHPGRFYDYAAVQGGVWVDMAKGVITQHHMPPTYPEFSDTAAAAAGFTMHVPANPILLTEHLLDVAHRIHYTASATSAASATTADRAAVPDIQASGVGRCRRVRGYNTPLGTVSIEHEFSAPYTSAVRIKRDGATVLLVMFSVLPVNRDASKLHVRVFSAIKFPLAETIARALVRAALTSNDVDAMQWRLNHLDVTDPADEFIAAYRQAVTRLFPELIRHFLE